MSWKREGKKLNVEVSTYYTIENFIDDCHLFPKTTRVFIDSNLSGNIKGEIESERIKFLGFDDLFLATGFSKDQVNKPTWIKEVVGKSPASLLL